MIKNTESNVLNFSSKRQNFIYDVSDIVDFIINGSGNGISFVAYNLLKEFNSRKNINLFLYANPTKIEELKKCCEKYELIKNTPKIDFSETFPITNIQIRLEIAKKENNENRGNKLTRLFIKMALGFLKKIKPFYIKFYVKNHSNLLKNIDFYFSPFAAIPDEVRFLDHIKKSVVIHDVIPLVIPEYKKGLKKCPLYKLFKDIKDNNIYFANSNFTKQDYIKYLPEINSDNVSVIPLSTGASYNLINDENIINSVKEKRGIPLDKKYVFSLCTLEPRKNLIFAIKNFIYYIEKNNVQDLNYVLGGGSWAKYEKELKKYIPEKYNNRILKIGYVNNEDMSALYSGAEAFIYPSLYEGFGMPILEAMYCGCPVICSNVTSMPEVIGDCGIQINPKCDEDLQNALNKMHTDNDFRMQCRQKGLERAKTFTWESCVDTIFDTLEIIK